MNGLAIDTATTKITISAKNDEHTVSAVFNIGMKQSETLLPAIDYVLSKANLTPKELNYLSITKGPGSFTGLRLGFSAIKALQMVTEVKLYGLSTLDVFAENYLNLPFTILSCIDAKKERFYAKAFYEKKEIIPEGDYTVQEIADLLESNAQNKNILICGSDSYTLFNELKPLTKKELLPMDFTINAGEILLQMTEKMINNNTEPLKDYDGPVYLRASEAEVKLK